MVTSVPSGQLHDSPMWGKEPWNILVNEYNNLTPKTTLPCQKNSKINPCVCTCCGLVKALQILVITWTNPEMLAIAPLGTSFNEIRIKIESCPVTKMHIKRFLQNGSHFVLASICTINPSHKSHNALDKYPTIHHSVTEMCTYMCKFLLQNSAL